VRPAHYLKLLTIDDDGHVRDAIEVAVYADADRRAVYTATLDNATLERIEERAAPDSPSYAEQEWRGEKRFAQAALSADHRKEAQRMVKAAHEAKRRGELLDLAIATADEEVRRANEWATARARYLATLDDEVLRKRYSGLLSALYGLDDKALRLSTQRQRLRFLQLATELLGLATRKKGHDG
jgi:hypothetical protein